MGARISRLIVALFGLTFLWIFGVIVFATGWFPLTPYPNGRLALIGGLVLGLMGFGVSRLPKTAGAKGHKLLILCTLLLLAYQLIYSYLTWFVTGWDSYVVIGNANFILDGNTALLDQTYYSHYPNNIFLTWLYTLLLGLGRLVGVGNFILIAFQCLLSALTGALAFLVSEKLTGSTPAAWWTWAVYALFMGTSPWVMIPYSDATGLIFPLLALWLYQQEWTDRRELLRWALMGAVTLVGFKLKPQLAIPAIALWLVEGANIFQTGETRQRAALFGKRLAAFALTFLLGMGLVEGAILPSTHIQPDREQTLGPAHFLMMGLREESSGGFYAEDVLYSFSIPTAKERTRENLRIAGERIKAYGPKGLIRHLSRKTALNYADGTFSWGVEGQFFLDLQEEDRDPVLSPFFKSLFYPGGSRRTGDTVFRQTLWLGLLLGCFGFLTGLTEKDKLSRPAQAALLAVLGLTLFELLFEARARYLYAYGGVFTVLGTAGWYRLASCFRRKKSGVNETGS